MPAGRTVPRGSQVPPRIMVPSGRVLSSGRMLPPRRVMPCGRIVPSQRVMLSMRVIPSGRIVVPRRVIPPGRVMPVRRVMPPGAGSLDPRTGAQGKRPDRSRLGRSEARRRGWAGPGPVRRRGFPSLVPWPGVAWLNYSIQKTKLKDRIKKTSDDKKG